MPVELKGATSGGVTIVATAVAGTNTLTAPAKTGTLITSADSGTVTQAMLASGVAGNGPAFSAYRSTNQTGITSSTFTKVQLNSENFDTANCFDSSTNYRFTPNIAGYYQINGSVYLQGVGVYSTASAIYKNGSLYTYGNFISVTTESVSLVSSLIYLNGSTDYVELYAVAAVTSGTVQFGGGSSLLQFSGALVRAA